MCCFRGPGGSDGKTNRNLIARHHASRQGSFMELDDQILAEIFSGRSPYLEQHVDNSRWLMLGSFRHISDDMLERLIGGIQNLEGIELGIKQLSTRMAKALLEMKIDFLCLSGLCRLDEQAAFVLGACPFDTRPIRNLRIDEPISERAATWLIGEPPPENCCDKPLSVSLPYITMPIAQALSRHTHELYLEVRDEILSPDVAEALSGHVGYSMALDCNCGFSDQTLLALFGNPEKLNRKVSQRNRVYLVDDDMWSSHYE